MRISQDVALGLLFVAIGSVALVMATDYPLGVTRRMGPGYFPTVIATLLVLVGLAVLVRARLRASPAVTFARGLPLVLIPASVVAFALLVGRLGLPLSVLVLTVASAAASLSFRPDWRAAAGAALFAAACAVVFVQLLGIPLPLAGSWLQPLAGG